MEADGVVPSPDQAAGPSLLVDPAWLQGLMLRQERRFVILEVLFPGEAAQGEHMPSSPTCRRCIPGAVSVHPSYFEAGADVARYYPNYSTPQDGNLLPDELLCDTVAQLGITSDTLVVVYGKGCAHTMGACRAQWVGTLEPRAAGWGRC